MDYLLTWNLKHIANAAMRDEIIEEVEHVREEIARRYDFDIDRMTRSYVRASQQTVRESIGRVFRMASMPDRSAPEGADG